MLQSIHLNENETKLFYNGRGVVLQSIHLDVNEMILSYIGRCAGLQSIHESYEEYLLLYCGREATKVKSSVVAKRVAREARQRIEQHGATESSPV